MMDRMEKMEKRNKTLATGRWDNIDTMYVNNCK